MASWWMSRDCPWGIPCPPRTSVFAWVTTTRPPVGLRHPPRWRLVELPCASAPGPPAATGLAADEVFYFGNAIGETGNAAGVNAIVNATDEILTRVNQRSAFTPAPITFPYDFNRDKQVNATDEILARLNTTGAFSSLRLITPGPATAAVANAPMAIEPISSPGRSRRRCRDPASPHRRRDGTVSGWWMLSRLPP